MIDDYNEHLQGYENFKLKYNYHTHNYMCHHAQGEMKDYAKVAVELGMTTLGFTDHFNHPLDYDGPYCTFELLSKQKEQFVEAKNLYGDKIRLLFGFEVEYMEGYDEFYQRLIKEVDYLVLGQHHFEKNGESLPSGLKYFDEEHCLSYLETLKKGVKTGYYKVLAHPDNISCPGFILTEKLKKSYIELFDLCKEYDVRVEINAQGARGHFVYPTTYLINLCKELDIQVIVSADAHNPEHLRDDGTKKLNTYVRNVGIKVRDDDLII